MPGRPGRDGLPGLKGTFLNQIFYLNSELNSNKIENDEKFISFMDFSQEHFDA